MMKRIAAFVFVSLSCGSVVAHAQTEASIVGTVTDQSNAVLPGVTVTATELSRGQQYLAITDERGDYQLAHMQPGTYKVQAELSGFANTVIPEIELLVGQTRTARFTMKLAQLSETLTVTGEAPLVDTRSSEVAGNVDRRQMDELPLSGRNWMELSMIIKGITANDVANNRPGVSRDENFQLNLDGQQITQKVADSPLGQPKFSRESIAEFQIVTNLFDIAQGRSEGIQVQAITRSGTNNLNGSLYGYFRDDKFNAADFIARRVLPFENQQVGGSIGGPIVRDKLHYFASYEYEREPYTLFLQPPLLPSQSFTFPSKFRQNSLMGRLDQEVSSKDHVSVRGSYWDFNNPFHVFGSEHPSAAATRTQDATNILGTWTRVLNNNMVQEVKIGYNGFSWANLLPNAEIARTPSYVFPGLTLGGRGNFPQEFHQNLISARYDFSWHRGAHDFKIGGDFLGWKDTGEWHLLERGQFVFNSRPADLERRFPESAWDNPAAWDVSGLDALVQRFDQNYGDWTIDIPRPTWAVWFGDSWRMTNKLTLNYGVRWDDDWGVTAPPHVTTKIVFEPLGGPLFRSDIRDHNNIAPRVGFAYNVGEKNNLVIRGGSGLYYSIPVSNLTFSQQSFNGQRILANSFVNDGRPGFIQDPTRGRTGDDFLSGRAPLPPQSPRVIAHDYKMPYTWHSSIGFQKQLGAALGVEADLTHWRAHNAARGRDINLFFDPVTAYNKDISRFGRPDPKFTQIQWMESAGSADYLALASAVTRRFKGNFQTGLTYTLMFYKHDDTTSFGILADNQFDLDAEWARSTDFQRHTLRATGIYQLPWGISLAGAYFFGSGNYYVTSDPGRPFGKPGVNRLRPDGTVVPRNGLKGDPLQKLDLRVTKEFRLRGDVKVAGIAELFNVFNHANFGAYNGQERTATYGRPLQATGNAYLPRSAQFAFRVTF